MAGNIINNKIGPIFQLPLRIGGLLLIIFSVAAFYSGGSGIVIGVILVLSGTFFSFSVSGIKINTSTKSVMNYTRVAFYTKGKYRDYSTYPYVTISEKKKNERNQEVSTYEIVMVSKSLRGRVLLEPCSSNEIATDRIQLYTNKLALEAIDLEEKREELGKIRNRMRT